jgi:hypothetical protein
MIKTDSKKEGHMFIRNICMAFDLRLIKKSPDSQIFLRLYDFKINTYWKLLLNKHN